MRSIYFFLSVLFCWFLQGFSAKAQNACNNSSAFVNNICLESSVAVGTQTQVGELYTWYKDGAKKRGPLSGNGGAISYDFAVNSAPDAGLYTIEKSVDGGPATCANKIQVVIVPLPQAQTLSGGGYMCSGFKTLRLDNSQVGIYYELVRKNYYGYYESVDYVYGTGGPIDFPVNQQGTFSMRASFQSACSQSYTYFGNETITQQPEFVKVVDFGTTTATLNWPGIGSHIIEYGFSGFAPGTSAVPGVGGTVVNTNISQTLLTGLTPGKGYDVYVRVPCEDGSFSNNVQSIFATGCSGQTVYPITENFETITAPSLPACWTILDVDQDAQLNISVGTGGVGGGKAVFVPLTADMLVLPALSLAGNKRLRFKIKSGTYYPEIFQVKLSATSNTPFSYNTTLLSDTLASGNYIEKTISLAGYTGTVYVAFQGIYKTYPSSYAGFYVDDVVVENVPVCAGAANLKADVATNNSASFSWQGSGSFIVEYGAPGFTPGTAATAGIGGTLGNTTNNFFTLAGLSAATSYDVYVRQNCTGSSNGFSTNSGKLIVTTFLNCVNAINIPTACSTITASVTAGAGLFDFNGYYPTNSCGNPTVGKELLYSFTPATTGVYYMEVLSSSSIYVNHFYKPASAGCNNKSWIGMHSGIGSVGRQVIGNLTAATTYYFLFDCEYAIAYSQTFKICRADVGTGNSCNSLSLGNSVPAYSTKKEYLLDVNGGLVAELDFSQVSTSVSFNGGNLSLNPFAVKRDFANKEYLDRSFYFNSYDSLKGTLGVKFYFKNTELARLVNEPDDGNSDVGGINDLNISAFGQDNCGSFTGVGTSIAQSSNAAYDVNSGTISFLQVANGKKFSYFFHGGLNPLTTDTSAASEANICPGSSAAFTMNDLGIGYTYQWQINTGSGFTNLVNNEIYANGTTRNLSIVQPPTNLYGAKFRCFASNGSSNVYSSEKLLRFSIQWTGNSGNEWLQPNNWSCTSSYRIPDANTDVIIPYSFSNSYPTIQTTVSCRSIILKDGATVDVTPLGKLIITGK